MIAAEVGLQTAEPRCGDPVFVANASHTEAALEIALDRIPTVVHHLVLAAVAPAGLSLALSLLSVNGAKLGVIQRQAAHGPSIGNFLLAFSRQEKGLNWDLHEILPSTGAVQCGGDGVIRELHWPDVGVAIQRSGSLGQETIWLEVTGPQAGSAMSEEDISPTTADGADVGPSRKEEAFGYSDCSEGEENHGPPGADTAPELRAELLRLQAVLASGGSQTQAAAATLASYEPPPPKQKSEVMRHDLGPPSQRHVSVSAEQHAEPQTGSSPHLELELMASRLSAERHLREEAQQWMQSLNEENRVLRVACTSHATELVQRDNHHQELRDLRQQVAELSRTAREQEGRLSESQKLAAALGREAEQYRTAKEVMTTELSAESSAGRKLSDELRQQRECLEMIQAQASSPAAERELHDSRGELLDPLFAWLWQYVRRQRQAQLEVQELSSKLQEALEAESRASSDMHASRRTAVQASAETERWKSDAEAQHQELGALSVLAAQQRAEAAEAKALAAELQAAWDQSQQIQERTLMTAAAEERGKVAAATAQLREVQALLEQERQEAHLLRQQIALSSKQEAGPTWAAQLRTMRAELSSAESSFEEQLAEARVRLGLADRRNRELCESLQRTTAAASASSMPIPESDSRFTHIATPAGKLQDPHPSPRSHHRSLVQMPGLPLGSISISSASDQARGARAWQLESPRSPDHLTASLLSTSRTSLCNGVLAPLDSPAQARSRPERPHLSLSGDYTRWRGKGLADALQRRTDTQDPFQGLHPLSPSMQSRAPSLSAAEAARLRGLLNAVGPGRGRGPGRGAGWESTSPGRERMSGLWPSLFGENRLA